MFAHGSGSSRRSPRNRQVATTLREAGLATLLFDLLTAAEASDRRNVFDIELLAERLAGASAAGRVDLASHLEGVGAPVRMIVGGADQQVLQLNRRAARSLTCEHDLQVVEGAGHLFAGPGELEEVADLARDWFVAHLT